MISGGAMEQAAAEVIIVGREDPIDGAAYMMKALALIEANSMCVVVTVTVVRQETSFPW
jgi:hypothetical protein